MKTVFSLVMRCATWTWVAVLAGVLSRTVGVWAEPGGPLAFAQTHKSQANQPPTALSRPIRHVAVSPSTPDSNHASSDPSSIIVVATVDGALHGIQKKTGETMWSTTHEWGALAKVVENPEGAVTDVAYPRGGVGSDQSLPQEGLIILEPVGDGALYSKGPDQTFTYLKSAGQKLNKSIKDIVKLNAFVTQSGIAYSSSKKTRLLAIDPITGKILQSFGAEEPGDANLKANQQFDDSMSEKEPIMISRTEYMVVISDVKSRKVKWNITYGEYEPATIPNLMEFGATDTPQEVIVGDPEVSVTANVNGGEDWYLELKSPALAAFSVSPAESHRHQVERLLTKGGRSKPVVNSFDAKGGVDNDEIWVGRISDTIYILSKENSQLELSGSPANLIEGVPSERPPPPVPSSADVAVTPPCNPNSPAYPSCLLGLQKATVSPEVQQQPYPQQRIDGNSGKKPLFLKISDQQAASTTKQLHNYFHISSGWRFFEELLGFTDRTEEFFIYVMTALTLTVVAAVGYYMSGVQKCGAAAASAASCLFLNGLAVTHEQLSKQYRGIVRKLSEAESLLPEHLTTTDKGNQSGVPGAPLNNVFSDDLFCSAEKDCESDESEESNSEVQRAREKERKAFEQLNEVMRDMKELPALPADVLLVAELEDSIQPPSSSSKKSKKANKGAAVGIVSKVHGKLVVSNTSGGGKGSMGNSKRKGKGENDADGTSSQDEDGRLELDNMDRLVTGSSSPERMDSDVTVLNASGSNPGMKQQQHDAENGALKTMTVSDQILGHGSHGTMVFKGTFENRPVAIKRLLLDFYDVAHHEVKILRDSDQHQNVVRYFYQEQSEKFMYIALELCPASLADVIENHSPEMSSIRSTLKPRQVLSQIMSGIQYIHSLKLVHRDVKPQNILIGESRGSLNSHPRILISDFGLCKRLAEDQSSFHNTMHTAGGTVGWRAPECMINQKPSEQSSDSEQSQWVLLAPSQKMRITKSIDIFSAGCVFYYYLTSGVHAFGDKYTREMNILRGNHRLDRLDSIFDGGAEAKDMIKKMIFKDPKKRLDSASVLLHPYFWTSSKKLAFLQDVSDRLESEEREPPSAILKQLERGAPKVVGTDWTRKLDRRMLEDMGKFRKYDGRIVQDLLRAMRNKKHHYQDLSKDLKGVLGPLPDGFLAYFLGKFPGLFMHVYHMIAENKGLRSESLFEPYFAHP
ncbi:hypothetical protein CcCBS67573_g02946 [Chytriomyces confervae]|uniref:non-specific serine/threonine protein kinase n=1 Tax=Chytriomyces confervae TaxID=246404 RepID=A0A507FK34_9FUNG|nr:hypothetical protein CcCBS67573_g02946 [Chytriomyces confervae]